MENDFDAKVKLRYRQPDQDTHIKIIDKNTLELKFNSKQRAVTIGQFAVLYDEDGMCYGGGRIDKLINT